MSLIDEVRSVEERVLARLRELEPLLAEYRELSALADRLGLEKGASADSAPAQPAGKPPRSRPTTKRRTAKRRAATRETREDQVLAAVRARPGATVAEVARELDVDATALYRVVRKLTKDGALTKRGLQLHLV
jgi:DNA invertase Pin-like site-specific DNA recombinase